MFWVALTWYPPVVWVCPRYYLGNPTSVLLSVVSLCVIPSILSSPDMSSLILYESKPIDPEVAVAVEVDKPWVLLTLAKETPLSSYLLTGVPTA